MVAYGEYDSYTEEIDEIFEKESDAKKYMAKKQKETRLDYWIVERDTQ